MLQRTERCCINLNVAYVSERTERFCDVCVGEDWALLYNCVGNVCVGEDRALLYNCVGNVCDGEDWALFYNCR